MHGTGPMRGEILEKWSKPNFVFERNSVHRYHIVDLHAMYGDDGVFKGAGNV